MNRPLLAICVRPQAEAAEAEYESFVRGSGLDTERLHRHDLVRQPLPADALDRYAGFLVGGSPFNVSDPLSTKSDAQQRIERELELLTREALDGRTALLLTCYGIGIATRLLGGTVTKDFPEEASASTVRTTAAAQTDDVARDLSGSFRALTAHKEGSGDVPPGATLLATNDDCPVQMYRAGEKLWATQFHPEPTTDAFTWRMAVYRDAGYFDPADYDRLAGAIDAAHVHEPETMLRRFVAVAAA